MNGRSRIFNANTSALALCEALDSINSVSVGVSAFGGRYFSRIFRHGEKLTAEAKKRFSIITGGGTCLHSAIVQASGDLLVQPQENKILIVITDGMPDNVPLSGEVIEGLRNSGVNVLGIGIEIDNDSSWMSEMFGDKYENINDASELKEAVFKMASKSI
jgi:Mg-chelatase subunit ChlD